jgi:hypothetical protein
VIQAQLQRLVREWRQSRRLRLGALAILLILGTHVVLTLADRRHARAEQYHRDTELLGRLEEASRESAWPIRAKAAEAMLATDRHSIPAARSDGLAQAEMQAWLTDLAFFAGLARPQVRVETSLAVPGQAGMWQVLARLDGNVPEGRMPVLIHALSSALPWVRTERLEIQAGSDTRVSLVVRGYFRQADARDATAPAARPADLPPAGQAAPVTPVVVATAGTRTGRTTDSDKNDGGTRAPTRVTGNPARSAADRPAWNTANRSTTRSATRGSNAGPDTPEARAARPPRARRSHPEEETP